MGLRSVLAAGAVLCGILPASAITLHEAVQLAVRHHPSVQARAAQTRAREAQLDQAEAALYPKLEINGDAGAEYDEEPGTDGQLLFRRQIGLTVGYVVFDGFDRANRIYHRAARIDAASRQVMAEAQLVALDAIEAYIDHRRHWFLLQVADENLAQHRAVLALAQAQLAGGAGTQGEPEFIRERLYLAEAARAEVYEAALRADAKFEAVVGVKPTNTHPVSYPASLPRSTDQALALAAGRHPAIAAASAEADALDYQIDRYSGPSLPEVSLESSATHGADLDGLQGPDTNWQAVVRLRWTLFDGGLREAQRNEAIELKAERQFQRDAALLDIKERIGRAWAALRAGEQRLAALQKHSTAARALGAQYRQEFEAGRRGPADILNAEAAIFNSRSESVGASSARLFAAYNLKALTGTLLDSLGVAPPREGATNYRARIPEQAPLFNTALEPLRID